MPIRPENRARYPKDWPAISRAAKDRAGWRCACTGECGRGTHTGRCPNRHGQAAYGTGSLVILTTAHLNHQPEDCHPDNLVPMCQGCHLHHDRGHHKVTAALTRAAGLAAAGQLTLEPVAALAVPTEPALPPALPEPEPASEPAPAQPFFDIPIPQKENALARITATIKPVHPDGTVCTHKVTSTGKPKESGCAGRVGFVARCSACSWTSTGLKVVLADQRTAHLHSHANAPTSA